MTVCVAIRVHDCIVFAADSATSLTITTPYGTSRVNNVWKHGLKVFNLHKDFPIVAMTTGMANFGTMSITNLTKDLRMKLMEDLCVETLSRKWRDVLTAIFTTNTGKPTQFQFRIIRLNSGSAAIVTTIGRARFGS